MTVETPFFLRANQPIFPETRKNSSNNYERIYYDKQFEVVAFRGYSPDKNCEWARAHKVSIVDKLVVAATMIEKMWNKDASIAGSGSAFFAAVGTGGAWDYKKIDQNYEDLGNYNFGRTAYCAGLSEVETKAAAGLYQIFSGTSKFEYIGSWFDDPQDFKNVMKGFKDEELKKVPEIDSDSEKTGSFDYGDQNSSSDREGIRLVVP